MIMRCETPSTGPAAHIAAKLQNLLPVIETERLVLRAPCIEDFSHYNEIANSPRGVYLLESPSREAAWFDFSQMVANWMLHGHGLWTVVDKEDCTVLGFVLLGFEPGDNEPELGYMFREIAEGKGLALEAAEAARAFGFGSLGLDTLVSTIDPGNERSRKLAERLGAVRDPVAEDVYDEAILVYRYTMPEALT